MNQPPGRRSRGADGHLALWRPLRGRWPARTDSPMLPYGLGSPAAARST
jgi:hypothetical protein